MPITGLKPHVIRLRKLSSPEQVRVVGQALFSGAGEVRAEAQRLITLGAVSGAGHVASLAGEAPNNDTGNLKNNIRETLPKPLEAHVTSSAGYAAALEFGTSRIEPRPYMRPARDNKGKRVTELVKLAMNSFVKRSMA